MLLKKGLKRNCAIIILFICGYYFVSYILENVDNGDVKEKINQIEESIHSTGNKNKCKIPILPHDAPDMMKFIKEEAPIECDNDDEEWISCHLSTCTIKKHIIQQKGLITCDFAEILRKDDYKFEYGTTSRTTNKFLLQNSDFAQVKCKASNGDRWYGTAIGIRGDVEIMKRGNSMNGNNYYNVLIYGFDSLSRNAVIRKLPKTYEYLITHLKADILRGYNIVGDGTPQALIPILTGFNELELPETRKRKFSSTYVNSFPMIWNQYKKAGFITAFNEDQPNIGTFSYRLNGFSEQPTDHYMRTFYLAVENDLHNYKRLCIGSKKRHQIMLDYTKDFMLKYNASNPRFVFSFHAELSHDSINLIGVADDDIKTWLEDLKASKLLENTILILMSDHGNRFAEIRNTLQGKLEERLPFFSFIFPQSFKMNHPQYYKNFQANMDHLTTPFDIHETLEDILHLQVHRTLKKQTSKRAISLFNKIPGQRTCADSFIEPHWCSCLRWEALNATMSSEAQKAANSVVSAINTYTEDYRHICELLSLDEVQWSAKLIPQESLLHFKSNKDKDGFLADLTANTKITNDMYQVKIVTSPSNAIYEATVMFDHSENTFRVKLSDISRVNKYGQQARCIYDENPELRKYCYCKP